MQISGKVLTKAQKRSFRDYLERRGLDPDHIFGDRSKLRSFWREYQQSLAGPPVPADSEHADSIEMEGNPKRRSRGPGKVPAGELYSVRLPPDLLVSMREKARTECCSLSILVRQALKAYFVSK